MLAGRDRGAGTRACVLVRMGVRQIVCACKGEQTKTVLQSCAPRARPGFRMLSSLPGSLQRSMMEVIGMTEWG